MKHLCIYIYIYIYYVTYNSLFALFYLPHCSHWFVDVDIHTPHPAFPHFLFSLPRLSFLKEKEEKTEKEKRKILENLFFFFFYSMSTRDQKRKFFFFLSYCKTYYLTDNLSKIIFHITVYSICYIATNFLYLFSSLISLSPSLRYLYKSIIYTHTHT